MPPAKKRPKPYEMKVVGAFMSAPKTDEVAADEGGQDELPIQLIDPSPSQPRRYFDPDKMSQLVASVKKKGILEPLLVRPKDDGRYELVAGERRLRAATEVGLETVPCVVRDFSDEEAAEIALLENLQRDDLNPVEETEGILELLSQKLNQPKDVVVSYFNAAARPESREQAEMDSPEWQVISELFEIVGRFTPNSFRTNRLPLLKLPPDILEATRKGEIEYSKARLIGRVGDDSKRSKLLEEAISGSLSREEIQQKVREVSPSTKGKASLKGLERMSALYRKAKKSEAWKDGEKRKQLEKLLDEMEKILEL
jgi:ParB family chromosome partitioning protein